MSMSPSDMIYLPLPHLSDTEPLRTPNVKLLFFPTSEMRRGSFAPTQIETMPLTLLWALVRFENLSTGRGQLHLIVQPA